MLCARGGGWWGDLSFMFFSPLSRMGVGITRCAVVCLKKNLNASRSSAHPPVRGENIHPFGWDHRLQIQNLFMAFKRVPRW